MPKHEKKKKKKKSDHSRHVLDLNELKELAKAHRHKDKAEIKKKAEGSVSKAAMVPQTKAEHDKEQSVVRKVVDPLTGRTRSVTYAIFAHGCLCVVRSRLCVSLYLIRSHPL